MTKLKKIPFKARVVTLVILCAQEVLSILLYGYTLYKIVRDFLVIAYTCRCVSARMPSSCLLAILSTLQQNKGTHHDIDEMSNMSCPFLCSKYSVSSRSLDQLFIVRFYINWDFLDMVGMPDPLNSYLVSDASKSIFNGCFRNYR